MNDNIIRLSLSENRYGFSPSISKEIEEELRFCHHYPSDVYFDVLKKISNLKKVDTEKIIIGNGLDDLINLISGYIYKSNLKIVTTKNTFNTINLCAKIFGKSIVELELEKFRISIDSTIHALDHVSNVGLIYVCNPHNPSGQMLKGELKKLLDYASQRNIVVFVDEAYMEFVDNAEENSCERYLSDYDNLIIGKTLSKIYGLAGLRFGYVLVSSIELAKEIRSYQLPYPVNRLACYSAVKALEDQKFIKEQYEKNLINKKYFEDKLNEFGIKFLKSSTNFIMLRNERSTRKIIYQLENEHNIEVKDCIEFNLDNMIRVGVGLPEEVDKFIESYVKLKNQNRENNEYFDYGNY